MPFKYLDYDVTTFVLSPRKHTVCVKRLRLGNNMRSSEKWAVTIYHIISVISVAAAGLHRNCMESHCRSLFPTIPHAPGLRGIGNSVCGSIGNSSSWLYLNIHKTSDLSFPCMKSSILDNTEQIFYLQCEKYIFTFKCTV